MLTRYDPFRTFDHLLRQTGAGERFWSMPIDAYRRGDEFFVELEGIQAHYDDGVLRLVIPVAEQAKPRKVAIDTGGQQAAVGAGAEA